MKEHPILFSSEMIKALLAGRKSVTRRMSRQWLNVKARDRLWVREHLRHPDGDPWLYAADNQPVMVAKADETAMVVWAHHKAQDYCPSIHMPRFASRITLEALEDARLERLQDITEEDAIKEGVEYRHGGGCFGNIVTYRNYAPIAERACDWYANPISSFRSLWLALHTKPGERWEDNPETVRVGPFRRIDGDGEPR